jgi:hypothetical protein
MLHAVSKSMRLTHAQEMQKLVVLQVDRNNCGSRNTELRELSLASNPLINEDDEGADADVADVHRPPSPRRAAFPQDLPALRKLKVLTLNCCDMEQLPEIVGEMVSLHTLHLSENRAMAQQHAFFFLPVSASWLKVCLHHFSAEVDGLVVYKGCTSATLRVLTFHTVMSRLSIHRPS